MNVDKIYNDILKKVERKMKSNTTTYSTDLDKIGKYYFGKHFIGCFASDEIPILNDVNCYCLVNQDKHNEPGSHWLALAYNKNKYYYYDSFGRNHKVILPTLNHRLVMNTEDDVEQDVKEINCGQRAIAWLILLHSYGGEMSLKL